MYTYVCMCVHPQFCSVVLPVAFLHMRSLFYEDRKQPCPPFYIIFALVRRKTRSTVNLERRDETCERPMLDFLFSISLTRYKGYYDVGLWLLELLGFLCAIIPLARNLMLVTDLMEDRTNVWDFKKTFVKWSVWEVPPVVVVLVILLMHGSYILASVHGVYTIWIVYQYANGRISAIDPTSVMRVKYQDDLSTDLTYRLVYYIFFAFVIFFGLVYFTAQSFIRHPSSIIQVRRKKNQRQSNDEVCSNTCADSLCPLLLFSLSLFYLLQLNKMLESVFPYQRLRL